MNFKRKVIRNEDDKKTPVMLKINGKKTTNHYEIAENYAKNLINKVDSLTKDLPDRRDTAISLFEKLFSKVEKDWELKTVNYKEVYKIVSKIKPSKSRGDNEVTNLMIREIPRYTTLATMHLFNSMVRTGTFPEEYKTSHVIPLKKKDKDDSDINSFRPLHNLNPIEKCLEQLVKNQMDKFLKDNNVLPEYHHGARKGHSTITATQAAQHKLNENKDKKMPIVKNDKIPNR